MGVDKLAIGNDEKRRLIRKYFAPVNVAGPIVVFAVGLLLLIPAGGRLLGAAIAVGSILWIIFLLRSDRDRPSDQTIDLWLREDIEELKARSLSRLNLEGLEKVHEPIPIRGPILWAVRGVEQKEVAWLKGNDGRTRCSIYDVTVIHFTEHKLSAYQCTYNFMRGAPLNEHDDEYYYRDVVSVSSREISTNYTLPNNSVMKHAQSFTLSVASGEHIEVIVSSEDIVKFTGGEVADTGLDDSIKAVRKVLGERKLLAG